MSDSDADFPTLVTKSVLVFGAVSLKKKVLMGLFRGLILYLLFLWYQNHFANNDGVFFVFLFIGVPYLCCELFLLAVFLSHRWLLVTDSGFIYSSLFGKETVLQENIIGYSIYFKELPYEIRWFSKEHTKYKRRFRLWVQGRSRPICLNYTGRNSQPDPLFDFIAQMINTLDERCETEIENGGTVHGNNWSLKNNTLCFNTSRLGIKSRTETLKLEEIGNIEVWGNRLHIWRKGSNKSYFSIPQNSKNTLWLINDLNRYIVPEEPSTEDRGLFLFEKKRSFAWLFFLFGFGAVLLLAMMGGIIGLLDSNMEQPKGLIFAVIFEGVILILLFVLWLRTYKLQFYDNGLVLCYPLFEREILFDGIETFQWMKTDGYFLGVYDSTYFNFVLFAKPESGIKKIDLSYQHHKGDVGTYQTFRYKLTQHLTHRMQNEWRQNKRVCWIEDVYLTDTAVVLERKKHGTVIESDILPYTQIETFGITTDPRSIFALISKNELPNFQFGTGNTNFYPGLSLFERIMQKELMWEHVVNN